MDRPPPPSAISGQSRTLADLHADVLAHCASLLDLRDLSSLALTCKPLRQAAYSDSVWRRLFTERWPHLHVSSGASGVRAEYLARHTALHQLKFSDPLTKYFSISSIPHSHILLNKNEILLAQGSIIQNWRLCSSDAVVLSTETLSAHSARITCMRLFPIVDTSLFRTEMQNEETVLVTSSSDRTIRLWWKGLTIWSRSVYLRAFSNSNVFKGRSQRCFRGHNGPVTTLSDKLLGDCGSKILASGGEDCTVRLWSVSSSGKHHPLMMTYHGHEKPVSFLSVARHKASLLVSISTDSRIKVWDTMASLSSSSSFCVGMASVSGPPVGLKCDDTLCYVAAGSSVIAIDLRTMRKVSCIAVHLPRMYSFEVLPSKWSICTGGEDKAMLWDIRKSQGRPKPVAELEAHGGRVTMLHMDPYKVVTGGVFDYHVNVWESSTGFLANSLDCRPAGESENVFGLSAMAVDGCRIVTSGAAEEPGMINYRDFSNCVIPTSPPDSNPGSKFWEPQYFA